MNIFQCESSEEGLKALENSVTVATLLLPMAFYFLMESRLSPIGKRRMSDIPMALAAFFTVDRLSLTLRNVEVRRCQKPETKTALNRSPPPRITESC
ncbi:MULTISPECIES: hypothetical protein [unclassified Endozoicomonas]|uniref:hypothetical protein n=1 Tax=unclassified Endozoicomonas TaxID=2644528 RepID=UPI0021475B21|nr:MULTISPECIES: hypothetical protein [unclassified Endozoicomonas]